MTEPDKSLFHRSSGLLMHISSLPGLWNRGDLGPSARKFIDILSENSQALWQILPLTIPDYTGSPYSSTSAFAANSQFISPQDLCHDKICNADTLKKFEIDYPDDSAMRKKMLIRTLAFNKSLRKTLAKKFSSFSHENQYWLKDFCLFSTLMDHHSPLWTEWPENLRNRNPEALKTWEDEHTEEMDLYAFEQFIFQLQWDKLKNYASKKNIQIIGDIPIFIAHNSVDVWAHRENFKLDDNGFPTVVAGVPPDVFSETGQLWGNPHYQWETLQKSNFKWWFERIGHILKQVDFVRLDHFRGFEAAWEVPASEKTAENGEWVKGMPLEFFDAFKNKFGEAPIIAEDLGIITNEVREIMHKYAFPGMKILQFSLDSGPDNDFLPQNYQNSHCIVYTGTHDNNTLVGWA
ncbi:MAG: 4-alpha-glucanotransferase, partial [Candidatus Marinimicrobia bacterium]|nr:4-alpha-glucanotransferase [Candidatus Neomarinimicrobiota bacterium]